MSKLLTDITKQYQNLFKETESLSLSDYLDRAKTDKTLYATAHERLLKAIGEPILVDTSKDPRLGRLYSNAILRTYEAFADFYGLEETIENIVGFLRQGAQGLEERRQVLYLLGPVGGGKSSLAERIKTLMLKEPFYAIEGSPVFDNPLSLFTKEHAAALGIPERYFITKPSPWLLKRLKESGGDLDSLKVVKLYPSSLQQVAMSRTEPGDENNQDISALVGKVDISKLHKHTQEDADAYSYSGALNRGNRGILEFVEMFKAPLKSLNPLLVATQEHVYNGTEAIGGMPFEGIILSHSNHSEWEKFKNNKTNEAFLDRIYLLKVPYCLRFTEEALIYDKLLRSSTLIDAPIAPKTLEVLAKFSVVSRLNYEGTQGNTGLHTKLRAYDGENVRETSTQAKPYHEYRQLAGINEGMEGISTRFAYKILSRVFNSDSEEVGADPVLLMTTLAEQVLKEGFAEDKENNLLAHLAVLEKEYRIFLDAEIRKSYVESFSDYGQNIFDRYINFVGALHSESDYRDKDTGVISNAEFMEEFLVGIEDAVGVGNRKDFRHEVYVHCLEYRASHGGKNPAWTADKKIKRAIESKTFSSLENIVPVISFEGKKNKDEEKKHSEFVDRMLKLGYSKRQIHRLVSWHLRTKA